MWSRRNFAVTALSVLFTTVSVSPADPVSITEFVTIAKQDAPVQILGFKFVPDVRGDVKVSIRNTTTKNVSYFFLMALYGDPRNGDLGKLMLSSVEPPSSGLQAGPDRSISPDGMLPDGGYREFWVESSEPLLNSIKQAATLDSDCLHTVVFVAGVFFSDKTKWYVDQNIALNRLKSDNPLIQTMWRDSIRPESRASCHDSPEIEQSLRQLKSLSWSDASPRSTNAVQSLSIECPLSTTGGEVTARCTLQ
jgi:hypothetical protein